MANKARFTSFDLIHPIYAEIEAGILKSVALLRQFNFRGKIYQNLPICKDRRGSDAESKGKLISSVRYLITGHLNASILLVKGQGTNQEI